ncbi:MAG: hypothetical protein L6R48_02485 [Planctomycetes bacterium]|nr:hypothetical protein [Planctomycetota bacterium]
MHPSTLLAWLLLLTAGGLAAAEGASPAAVKPSSGQAVLVKLDDLTRHGKGPDGLPPERWLRVTAFLKEQGLKANFGIFAESLQGDCPRYVAWLKEQAAGGLVEYWHHGWYNRFPKEMETATRTGEFKGASAEEQGALITRSLALMQEKTGLAMVAYGPHGMPLVDGDAAAAYQAMAGIAQLRAVWFYGPPKGTTTTLAVIPRTCELEKPLFKPNAENVRATLAAKAGQVPVLAMQGHPGAWDDERFEEFRQAMLHLKEQGCRFLTVSEWLAARPAGK